MSLQTPDQSLFGADVAKMNPNTGMLTLKQLTDCARTGLIETVIVAFADCYGRLMGKRLDVDFFLDNACQEGVGACNYLLTVDMEMNVIAGYDFANWEKGYGDFKLRPDLNTLRYASWLDRTALVICDVIDEDNHALVDVAPRTILHKQLAQFQEQGMQVKAASELEYYLFKDDFRTAKEKQYNNLQAAGWYIEDYHLMQGTREENFHGAARRHLKRSGIPVESSKGEWGCGQHELNIRYAEALDMADRHVIFKQCLKELAIEQEVSITFMAKHHTDEAGSSCHVHISLWRDNNSVFLNSEDHFKWFLGGLMHYAPELMVFYAPTVNAYKRFQSESWAPTRIAWANDNRTAGFRIVGKGSDALRIECRLAGADCNPYLVYAAMLASGLAGIREKIALPDETAGDVYAAKQAKKLPSDLNQAVQLFAQSELAKAAFGEEVVKHYVHFYETEWKAYYKAVTDWERERYFERI